MALNIGVKFEGKLTFTFKNDMRNLANFHQSMFKNLKIGTFIVLERSYFYCVTGELCVMVMKSNAKFEKESTCQFKTDMRNLTNFDRSTRKTQKITL